MGGLKMLGVGEDKCGEAHGGAAVEGYRQSSDGDYGGIHG